MATASANVTRAATTARVERKTKRMKRNPERPLTRKGAR